MVRIAIPTDDGQRVSSHFGRARYFLIAEFENGEELSRHLVENSNSRGDHGHGSGNGSRYGHNHNHNHSRSHGHEKVFLSTGDIQGVIAVRIGPHMIEELKSKKIGVYLVPINSTIEDAIKLFSEDKLRNILNK